MLCKGANSVMVPCKCPYFSSTYNGYQFIKKKEKKINVGMERDFVFCLLARMRNLWKQHFSCKVGICVTMSIGASFASKWSTVLT
uniref:Uncharacterized protein n=1 Tax=Rhizophora mucronata TaxID=61149 RepID=A0A2P2M335_RHIMU